MAPARDSSRGPAKELGVPMQQQSSAASAQERRLRRILEEAETRYRHELMDDQDRLEVLDRIRRLRRAIETNTETVDAIHSGLDRA